MIIFSKFMKNVFIEMEKTRNKLEQNSFLQHENAIKNPNNIATKVYFENDNCQVAPAVQV